MKRSRNCIVFDLDDTLIDTSDVYWRARTRYIHAIVDAGVDAEEALEQFERVDAELINKIGFLPNRYGLTMMRCYQQLLAAGKVTASSVLEGKLEKCGSMVPNEIPKLIDGAIELLHWAADRYELALLTRGETSFQMTKIQQLNLQPYFKTIEVVPQKGPSEFLMLLAQRNLTPSDCWVIGDSIKSDINPAVTIGALPILFVYTHPTYHWRQEYGAAAEGPFFKIFKLRDAIPILTNPESTQMVTSLDR